MSKHCDGVITGPVTDGLNTHTRLLNYQYQKLSNLTPKQRKLAHLTSLWDRRHLMENTDKLIRGVKCIDVHTKEKKN